GLAAASKELAGRLVARGVRRGDVVAVLLPRSQQLPVALLGVLRAGAAYLPVDPDYPLARVRFMMSDAAVACVVTERGCQAVIATGVPAVFAGGNGAGAGGEG